MQKARDHVVERFTAKAQYTLAYRRAISVGGQPLVIVQTGTFVT